MALWVCAGPDGCGTKYAVGLFRCPRCLNTAFFEDGDPMAKITRHGGASDATLPTEESAAVAEPVPAPVAAADQPEPQAEVEAEALDVTEYLAAPPEPAAEESGEEKSGEPAPSREQPDYETWTVEQLKEQLDSRGLPKTGKKDDLVLRLLEDDDTRTAQDTE